MAGGPAPLHPWSLKWVDFALFIWTAFMVSLLSGAIGLWLARLLAATPEGKSPPMGLFAIVSGLCMHGGFIAVFTLWHRAHRGLRSGPVDTRPLAPLVIVGRALLFLLAAYPLLALVTGAWEALLRALGEAGLPVAVKPQDAVGIFADYRSEPLSFLALALVAVVLAPIAEELVFRAGVYRFLLSRFSRRRAILVSSLLFGVLHFSLFGFLPLALLGVVLCLAYDWTGNIRVPIVLHMLFNLNTVALVWLFPEIASAL
ncbi:MAG: CPBP family intramembrane glutamic endopeptidase [Opitutales bacterium]